MADFSKQNQSGEYAADVIERARAFAKRQHKQLIGNEWVSSENGATFDVINPATEEYLSSCASGTKGDVDRAIASASAAFKSTAWANMTPESRSALLLKIADLLESHTEELAAIQSFDLGANAALSRALVGGGVETFRYYAGWPTKIAGATLPSDSGRLSFTVREPLGVVGSIIPWNGPGQATAWKIAPALAAGNTVVFKPASEAPLVSIRMVELMIEAGLPSGVLNLVTGTGTEVGQAIVEHSGIAKVSFTGSTEVGKSLMATAAQTLKKVTLELGGKSPTILFADADLTKAIPSATLAFCAGAGQGCVAGTRILVEASIYKQVVQLVSHAATAYLPPNIPPIISKRQLDKIQSYIELGKSEGATLIMGGGVSSGSGFYVEPTIFADVTPDMTIAREEIFGPVVVIIPFSDEADAISLANDSEFGLSASVWTQDVGRMHRMIAALEAGTVWGNTIFEIDTKAPFGGYKQSGLGRELGPESLEAYTQLKTAMIRYA